MIPRVKNDLSDISPRTTVLGNWTTFSKDTTRYVATSTGYKY